MLNRGEEVAGEEDRGRGGKAFYLDAQGICNSARHMKG